MRRLAIAALLASATAACGSTRASVSPASAAPAFAPTVSVGVSTEHEPADLSLPPVLTFAPSPDLLAAELATRALACNWAVDLCWNSSVAWVLESELERRGRR